MTTRREAPAHDVRIGHFGDKYRAVCKTCGWQSRDYDRRRDAEDDGTEHATHSR